MCGWFPSVAQRLLIKQQSQSEGLGRGLWVKWWDPGNNTSFSRGADRLVESLQGWVESALPFAQKVLPVTVCTRRSWGRDLCVCMRVCECTHVLVCL